MAQSKAKPKGASKVKKRTVKNPETFRERALKAGQTAESPDKTSRLKASLNGPAKVVAKFFKPLAGPARAAGKYKAVRLLGRIVFPAYFRSSVRELKLVKWPTWRDSLRLTSAVLIFAVIFGIVIALVDYGLDKLFRHILIK